MEGCHGHLPSFDALGTSRPTEGETRSSSLTSHTKKPHSYAVRVVGKRLGSLGVGRKAIHVVSLAF